MRSDMSRILWAVVLIVGLLGLLSLGSVAGSSEDNEQVTEDQETSIPEKPGGIPHELDGPYATCDNCHELSIPPHPPMVHDCLICHTQAIDD